MVISALGRFFWPVIGILLLSGLTSCSLKGLWGEKPKSELGVVRLEQSPGASCPDFTKILTGTEDESLKSFECWASQVDVLFSQVVGRSKDSLTDGEIATLVRKQIVQIPGDQETSLKTLFILKKFLGFGPELTKPKVENWVVILRNNRPYFRDLYHRWTGEKGKLFYSDVEALSQFFNTVLLEMNWVMTSEELGGVLDAVLQLHEFDFKNALAPAARVSINLLNGVCPTFSIKNSWNAKELADCLPLLTAHFKGTGPWFDFFMNSMSEFSTDRRKKITEALDVLTVQAEIWFNQPSLSVIQPDLWLALGSAMGAPSTEDFKKSFQLLEKFNPKSTGGVIHPSAMIRVLSIIKKYELALMGGLGYFFGAVEQYNCTDSNATKWYRCVPQALLAGVRDPKTDPQDLDLYLKVKNLHFGQNASPPNGKSYRKVMLFNVFASELISMFDEDHDGRLSINWHNDKDEVTPILNMGVEGYQIALRFVDNLNRKVHHKPLNSGDSLLFRSLDLKGLANLITMTTHLLVLNDPKSNGTLDDFDLVAPNSSSYLDQTALTAVFTMMDSLSDFREAYIQNLLNSQTGPGVDLPSPQDDVKAAAANPDAYIVLRESFIENLPEIMKQNFPRTYESCEKFGFTRSCGISFNKIIPPAIGEKIGEKIIEKNRSGYIHVGDLDLLTLVAATMEGLFDNCDFNRDGKLTWTLIGTDELDCAFLRGKDILTRMLDARIIQTSKEDEASTKLLLNMMNSVFVTRAAGKIAMVRGTTAGMILNIPLFMFYNGATFGSLYGLVSNILDPDQTNAIDKQQSGQSPDPTDNNPPGNGSGDPFANPPNR